MKKNIFNIIVEGPDGSGKSTLVKKLSKVFKFKTYHIGNPITNYDFIYEYLNFLEIIKSNSIIDRFSMISETIYSKIFNRTPRIKFDSSLSILKNKWVIIFCFVDEVNIINGKPYKSNEWYNSISNNKTKIKNEYVKIFNMLKYKYPNNVFSYNYKKDSLGKLIEKIKVIGGKRCIK